MPSETVALLGYGLFGRAFSGLLTEAGISHRVLDARPEQVPEALRVDAHEALCRGASLVIVAVPVPALREALERLRPHLTPEHTVLDVGSVKVRPVEAMASVLAKDIPWVGTHPLFGPNSLARGERPLKVVVCPNTLHPDAVAKARTLFERLGCEVLELTPAAHDEVMARTHALTFFLARGLLDAGAGEGVPFAPPSFQPVSRLVEQARREVAHLFSAVQAENPYARDVREELLDTLTQLHRGLDTPGEPGGATPGDGGRPPPGLTEIRAEIDALDHQLLDLLQRRTRLVRQAGRLKAEHGLPMPDMEREARVMETRRQWATEQELDPEAVGEVFRALLRASRRTRQD